VIQLAGWLARKERPSWQLRVKRAVDVVGAATGLVLLGPALGVAAAAVRLKMGAPVLFRQQRPGFRERPFTLVKLRTMAPPGRGETWYRTDHERLSRLGGFLRASSIDEVPTLWNVLVGDMSLVGPRPLLLEYLDKYTAQEKRRHEMPPGITGWAQVNGRQTIPFSKRLELDVWYVDHFSLWLDAKILMATVVNVFRSDGVIVGQNVDDVDDLGLSADRERVDALVKSEGQEGAMP